MCFKINKKTWGTKKKIKIIPSLTSASLRRGRDNDESVLDVITARSDEARTGKALSGGVDIHGEGYMCARTFIFQMKRTDDDEGGRDRNIFAYSTDFFFFLFNTRIVTSLRRKKEDKKTTRRRIKLFGKLPIHARWDGGNFLLIVLNRTTCVYYIIASQRVIRFGRAATFAVETVRER